jgi:hypothetical protein
MCAIRELSCYVVKLDAESLPEVFQLTVPYVQLAVPHSSALFNKSPAAGLA